VPAWSASCRKGFSLEIGIGIGIGIAIGIDAVGRLILSNSVASFADRAEHRGHPEVSCVQAPYLFDPDTDTDPDFDFDYPNHRGASARPR